MKSGGNKEREDNLAQALRANLLRRKEQRRARSSVPEPTEQPVEIDPGEAGNDTSPETGLVRNFSE